MLALNTSLGSSTGSEISSASQVLLRKMKERPEHAVFCAPTNYGDGASSSGDEEYWTGNAGLMRKT